MWAKAQRPGNTCSKVITCFLFTFFYLHSDLMAIKSEAKANAACIKTKKRNEITTHAVNFNAHTHTHTNIHAHYQQPVRIHNIEGFELTCFSSLIHVLVSPDFFLSIYTTLVLNCPTVSMSDCAATWRLQLFAIETWRFAYCMRSRSAP